MKNIGSLVSAVVTALAFAVVIAVQKEEPINHIVAFEDHPWIIKNETCLNTTGNFSCSTPCYTGIVMDMMQRIDADVKIFGENCTISEMDSLGTINATTNNSSTATGLLGVISKNESDMGLAIFEWDDNLKGLQLPVQLVPIWKKQSNNVTLTIPFSKSNHSSVFHMIRKLHNQRHIEQLHEKWCHDYAEGSWDKAKQRSGC